MMPNTSPISERKEKVDLSRTQYDLTHSGRQHQRSLVSYPTYTSYLLLILLILPLHSVFSSGHKETKSHLANNRINNISVSTTLSHKPPQQNSEAQTSLFTPLDDAYPELIEAEETEICLIKGTSLLESVLASQSFSPIPVVIVPSNVEPLQYQHLIFPGDQVINQGAKKNDDDRAVSIRTPLPSTIPMIATLQDQCPLVEIYAHSQYSALPAVHLEIAKERAGSKIHDHLANLQPAIRRIGYFSFQSFFFHRTGLFCHKSFWTLLDPFLQWTLSAFDIVARVSLWMWNGDPTLLRLATTPEPTPPKLTSVQSERLVYGLEFPDAMKHKFDFASHDSGARIIDSSPSIQNVKSIQKPDSDSYLLVPCTSPTWFVMSFNTLIYLRAIALGFQEFYSSTFRIIEILGSDVYPTDQWRLIAVLSTRADQSRELFDTRSSCSKLGPSDCWVRYILVRVVENYQIERYRYCTLNRFQVFGSDVLESLDTKLKGEEDELKKVNASSTTPISTDSIEKQTVLQYGGYESQSKDSTPFEQKILSTVMPTATINDLKAPPYREDVVSSMDEKLSPLDTQSKLDELLESHIRLTGGSDQIILGNVVVESLVHTQAIADTTSWNDTDSLVDANFSPHGTLHGENSCPQNSQICLKRTPMLLSMSTEADRPMTAFCSMIDVENPVKVKLANSSRPKDVAINHNSMPTTTLTPIPTLSVQEKSTLSAGGGRGVGPSLLALVDRVASLEERSRWLANVTGDLNLGYRYLSANVGKVMSLQATKDEQFVEMKSVLEKTLQDTVHNEIENSSVGRTTTLWVSLFYQKYCSQKLSKKFNNNNNNNEKNPLYMTKPELCSALKKEIFDHKLLEDSQFLIIQLKNDLEEFKKTTFLGRLWSFSLLSIRLLRKCLKTLQYCLTSVCYLVNSILNLVRDFCHSLIAKTNEGVKNQFLSQSHTENGREDRLDELVEFAPSGFFLFSIVGSCLYLTVSALDVVIFANYYLGKLINFSIWAIVSCLKLPLSSDSIQCLPNFLKCPMISAVRWLLIVLSEITIDRCCIIFLSVILLRILIAIFDEDFVNEKDFFGSSRSTSGTVAALLRAGHTLRQVTRRIRGRMRGSCFPSHKGSATTSIESETQIRKFATSDSGMDARRRSSLTDDVISADDNRTVTHFYQFPTTASLNQSSPPIAPLLQTTESQQIDHTSPYLSIKSSRPVETPYLLHETFNFEPSNNVNHRRNFHSLPRLHLDNHHRSDEVSYKPAVSDPEDDQSFCSLPHQLSMQSIYSTNYNPTHRPIVMGELIQCKDQNYINDERCRSDNNDLTDWSSFASSTDETIPMELLHQRSSHPKLSHLKVSHSRAPYLRTPHKATHYYQTPQFTPRENFQEKTTLNRNIQLHQTPALQTRGSPLRRGAVVKHLNRRRCLRFYRHKLHKSQ